ncbi:hypothetical protein C8A05DRAFT_30404 [Staphylotrichum tortipilum]|uniref:Uncharacterized protein n=1 Tax=Staphylotrichum tortipilum TaxID=2831512 RepID=A0AAN6MSL7_9PEZI|nr:hypothetical protein C8A05DRAFT_30404 [Staphylotrichum longicolle]
MSANAYGRGDQNPEIVYVTLNVPMEARYNNGKRELHPMPEGSTFAGGRPIPVRMSRPPPAPAPAPRPRPPPAPQRSGCSVGAALLVIFIIKVIIVLAVLAALHIV